MSNTIDVNEIVKSVEDFIMRETVFYRPKYGSVVCVVVGLVSSHPEIRFIAECENGSVCTFSTLIDALAHLKIEALPSSNETQISYKGDERRMEEDALSFDNG